MELLLDGVMTAELKQDIDGETGTQFPWLDRCYCLRLNFGNESYWNVLSLFACFCVHNLFLMMQSTKSGEAY